MNESILNSVKLFIGIGEDYDCFDQVLIMDINSVFMILTQLGVGPPEGFYISDSSATWSNFISDEIKQQAVKSYVEIKVSLLFDPPKSSIVLEAMKQMAAEYEWRLKEGVESDG